MKKDSSHTKFLDEFLASVEGIQEAETNPFFYIQLTARMQKQEDSMFPFPPGWLVAGLVALLVINGSMAISRFTRTPQHSVTAQTSLQSFASGYDLTIQSTY